MIKFYLVIRDVKIQEYGRNFKFFHWQLNECLEEERTLHFIKVTGKSKKHNSWLAVTIKGTSFILKNKQQTHIRILENHFWHCIVFSEDQFVTYALLLNTHSTAIESMNWKTEHPQNINFQIISKLSTNKYALGSRTVRKKHTSVSRTP